MTDAQDPQENITETPSAPIKKVYFLQRTYQRLSRFWAIFTLIAFLLGSFGGYVVNEQRHAAHDTGSAVSENTHEADMAEMAHQVNPPDGYTLPASYGAIGPALIAAGAFEYDVFVQVYEQAGQPLSEKELAILTQGSDEAITINRQNAYFLLNLFWAFGLTNRNRILTDGPIVERSDGKVEDFASTGGWSLAAKPIPELFASAEIVALTPEQQKLVEKVAQDVFRPCCNNPTHFPDCNHGMAMLGLLELMASQEASEKELFEAAKYVNAFWYPSQYMELATFFQSTMNQEYGDVAPQTVVGGAYSSGS
ncbi:MAG: hypothetical protein EHM70_18325, partial [Chloroflexota bacterium]